MKRNFVVAMTGASGAVYALRLIDVLTSAGCDVHLTISAACVPVMRQELDLSVDLLNFNPAMILPGRPGSDTKLQQVRSLAGISSEESSVLSVGAGEPGEVLYHHFQDLDAPIASGSFLTEGMIVCPCSMGTLSAIVHGSSTNLIHRAAEVHLKERRRLILVARETPLSVIHLENMTRAAQAGATILPAMPGFYHGVKSIQDLIDFIVARICDHLRVEHDLIRRWGSE